MNRYTTYYGRSILVSEKFLFAVDTVYGRIAAKDGTPTESLIKGARTFWESFFIYYGGDKPWGKDKAQIMGETARKLLP